MARVLSLRLFVFIEFSHIFNGCEKPRAANAYFFTESIFMLATSSISMHFPQLSQILSGSRSHSSHSPQPIHFLSYKTHSSSSSGEIFLLSSFIGITFLITNYRKGVFFAIFRDRSGAVRQVCQPETKRTVV